MRVGWRTQRPCDGHYPWQANSRKQRLHWINAPDSEEEPGGKWLFLAPCWARTGALSERPVTRTSSNGAFCEVEASGPPGADELRWRTAPSPSLQRWGI